MLQLGPAIELGLVACAVALLAKYLRLPYTIALVVAGLVLGASNAVDVHLSKELILLLFLPPLLFEGALHMDLEPLRRYATPVGILSLVGTLVSAGVIALVTHYAVGLAWQHALLLGVILSPTDPVSVLAMFREFGAPRGLQVVLEGESVFNDGVGIVLYLLVLDLIGGQEITPFGAVLDFALVAFGGAAVGLTLGYVAHRILGRIDDHLIEVMISVVLAFGAYALAESLHVSGVVSVVAAGLIIGNYGTVLSMSPTTRLSLLNFWAVAAFLVNSALFLLIGQDFHFARLAGQALPVVAVIAGLLLSRALVVYPLVALSNRVAGAAARIPPAWAHVLNWGGLRGAIPIALALGLAPELRNLGGVHLPTIVFTAVLFSLLVQGLSVKPLMLRLGLSGAEAHQRDFERSIAEIVALRAATQETERLRSRGEIGPELHERTLRELEGQRAQATLALEELTRAFPGLRHSQEERLNRALALVERDAVAEALRRGQISEEAAHEVSARINAALELGVTPDLRGEPEA